MEVLYWLIALAILLVIEIITLGLTTIWFAGGALVAFIAAMFQLSIGVQFALFFFVSFMLLFFTRPVALKYFNKQRIKTNCEALIGQEGRTVEKIDNFAQKGQVILKGQEWSARSFKDERVIEPGTPVYVKKIEGVKLIVTDVKEEI